MKDKCDYFGTHTRQTQDQGRGGKTGRPRYETLSWCTYPENETYRKFRTDRHPDVECLGDKDKCHFPEVWKKK